MGVQGLWVNEKSSFSLNHYILASCSPGCISTHLHSNDGIDEEQHGNEQADIRQSLKTNINTGSSESEQKQIHGTTKSYTYNPHTHILF